MPSFKTYYTPAPMRAKNFLMALTMSDRSDGKTFSIKEPDPKTWEGMWSLVYDKVKDMSFDDVLADFKEYDKHTGKHIVFPFNAQDDYGDECDTQVSLHSLVEEWLRDDAHDSELLYQTYANESDEYVEFVED